MARWQRSSTATWRTVAGSLVVAAPDHAPVTFSPPAAHVWSLLQSVMDEVELAGALHAPPVELSEFLGQLRASGAVELVP